MVPLLGLPTPTLLVLLVMVLAVKSRRNEENVSLT
jgi:hypothetical protein